MRIPERSSDTAPTLGLQWSVAMRRAQMGIEPAIAPRQSRNGGSEESMTTRCDPCGTDGWQHCTTYQSGEIIRTFRRLCTSCDPCLQTCRAGGVEFIQNCTSPGPCCQV